METIERGVAQMAKQTVITTSIGQMKARKRSAPLIRPMPSHRYQLAKRKRLPIRTAWMMNSQEKAPPIMVQAHGLEKA